MDKNFIPPGPNSLSFYMKEVNTLFLKFARKARNMRGQIRREGSDN